MNWLTYKLVSFAVWATVFVAGVHFLASDIKAGFVGWALADGLVSAFALQQYAREFWR